MQVDELALGIFVGLLWGAVWIAGAVVVARLREITATLRAIAEAPNGAQVGEPSAGHALTVFRRPERG